MIRNKALLSCICLSMAGSLGIWAADTTDYDTDTIVVTAKRYEAPKPQQTALPVTTQIQKQQSNMTVVTAKDIEKNNYTTAQEVLKNINGVTMTEQVPGTSAYIRLNGDDRVLILVDGQAITNAQSAAYGRGTTDLQTLPGAENIDHIEVTKGSGSVKYGSGAVGGVINIVTKKGQENKTTLDVNTGSWGTHNYTLTNGGSHGNTSWYVTGGISHRNYYKFNDTAYTADKSRGDYNKDFLTARIDQKLNDSSSLTFNVVHTQFDGHATNIIKTKTVKVGDKNKSVPIWPYKIGNKKVERLNNNYNVTYHFGENTATPGFIRYFNDYSANLWAYHFHSRTQGIQAENSWKLGTNQILTGGVEWTKDEGSNAEAGYVDKKRTNRAAYLEDSITTGKLTVTPGIRIDDNSQFGTHKTPRIALNYPANNKFNVSANWSRVFAAPKLNDLYYWLQTPDKTSTGNPDLNPETGYTQNIGFSYQYDPKTEFTVNFFRSSIDNAIRWDRGRNYAAVRNLNREEKRGMELSINKTINDSWDYELGYSYIHAKIDEGKGLHFDTTFNRPNGYHAGLHFHHDAWKANVLMNAGTGRNDTYYLHDSYITWDANVSYDVTKNLTLYTQVSNLTNEGYDMYYTYPSAGRCWLFGAKYTF